MDYRILAINPGSTSTKVGCFQGEKPLLRVTVPHDRELLSSYATVSDQLLYRKETVLSELTRAGVDLATMDAFVGRGGGLLSVEGGTYLVDETLLDHARRGANGVQHPAQLGSQIAWELAAPYGKPSFVVNPPDTDELCLSARITGVKGIYRRVHLHALNLKETAMRHSSARGWRYEDRNYVVCHLGGGISVSAHERGRMIDGNDIVGGEGPMAPTRCGALPVTAVIDHCFSGVTREQAKALCTQTGGFASHLGTSDAREVFCLAQGGDREAKQVWDALLYQLKRSIGAMAAVLGGRVDGILLSGGMVHNRVLVDELIAGCSWIAPVTAYPGEFELEAMAAGACRVLSGQEQAKRYSGRPAWTPETTSEGEDSYEPDQA